MSSQPATARPATRIVLIGLVSLAIAMGIGRFAFTPLLPLMQQDGLVDIGGGGALAAIHFIGYWIGAVAATRLSAAPRVSLQASLLAIGVSTLGMGLTENFILWSVLRWLAGLCSAFTLVLVGNYYVRHLAETGRPGRQGWIFSGVGAGIAVAGLATLAIMLAGIGSAASWQVFGVGTLLAAIAVSFGMGPELTGAPRAERQDAAQRRPLVWSIIVAYGVMGLGYIIPATYLPVMAREIVASPLLFGWAWPVFGVSAFVSTIIAARLQPRYTNRQIWAVSQTVMAIGLLLPVIYPHIATIIAAGICVGGTFMIITMMGMKEAHRIVPPADVMRHIAVLTAAFASGQIVGPVFASAVYGVTQTFSAALVITAMALVAALLPMLRRAPSPAPASP